MPTFRRARVTGSTDMPVEATIVEAPVRAGLTPVSEWMEQSAARPSSGPTSSLFSGVCRYYHDCFAADSRGGILTNVLDKN
ncbi:MAG: hypothetical protein ACXVA4_09625, partial [Ktedonobacterales bacterium]